MGNEGPKMQRPTWKHEINLNTVLLLAGILVTGAGWGVTWQMQVSATSRNSERIGNALTAIADMRADLRLSIAEINTSMKTYADLPYRVTALEGQVATMTGNQRELERSLSQLASDMRVTREIVERLDPARGGASSSR